MQYQSAGQFSRTEMLLGKDAMEKLSSARVAVVGIGGVGSYTVEALARSGVGSLMLVDSDTVSPSNINRQLHATVDTIGRHKTLLMRERVLSINPGADVETQEVFCLPENVPEVLSGNYDYIVDAVDTVSAKLAIIQEAKRRKIQIISAMGAGNKLDPSRFRAADIYSTSVCPLCRVMRRELKALGISELKVVYSDETPLKPAPLPYGEEATKRETPGSVAFVPSAAGLIIAAEVVMDLTQFGR